MEKKLISRYFDENFTREERDRSARGLVYSIFFTGVVLPCLILGYASCNKANEFYKNHEKFKFERSLEEGYISKYRVEHGLRDSNNNGKLEQFLRIDGIDYEFKEVDGKPILIPSVTNNMPRE